MLAKSPILRKLLLLLLVPSAYSAVIYVDNTVSSTGDGSQNNPFNYLDDALTSAFKKDEGTDICFIKFFKTYSITKSYNFKKALNLNANFSGTAQESVWVFLESAAQLTMSEGGILQLNNIKIQKSKDYTVATSISAAGGSKIIINVSLRHNG